MVDIGEGNLTIGLKTIGLESLREYKRRGLEDVKSKAQ